MRVLLIIPTVTYKSTYPCFLSSQDFPVGFAYLASALKSAGHEVFGLNLNNDVNYSSAREMVQTRVVRTINEVKPDLVGIGGLCTDYAFITDTMALIRSNAPDTPIVCGGGIVNNDTEFIFRTLKPDFCIAGEAEEAIVKLADCLSRGDRGFGAIDNLGYWEGGEARFAPHNSNYIDINELLFPDYEPFNIRDMLDNYSLATRILHRYPYDNPRPMTIVTARSCPFQCTFCVHHRRDIKYRARTVENIIQEIAYLYDSYQFNILVMHDELFAVNKRRLKEFCDQLRDARRDNRWDFKWLFQTHASAALDREALQTAKDSGCYFFSYGLESASPTVLASMNKKTKPEQIIDGIRAASDVGIAFAGNFIFGDIAETRKTIYETMHFFKTYCQDIHLYFGAIQPYPGSKIFESCMEKKIITDMQKYYNTIGEGVYNMTSIPDWIWYRWIAALNEQSNRFSWVKAVDALSAEMDSSHADNPYLVQTNKTLYRVGARCPHCGKESTWLEPLQNMSVTDNVHAPAHESVSVSMKITKGWLETRKLNNLFLTFIIFFAKAVREVMNIIIRRATFAVATIITNRMSIFRIVRQFDIKGIHSDVTFITGCRECNKRFRINIDPGLLS